MNFNQAQEAAINGKFITRRSWGNGQYVYASNGTVLTMEQVQNAISIPEEVKQEILDLGKETFEFGRSLIFKYENFAVGFLPLIDDLTADDWYELG